MISVSDMCKQIYHNSIHCIRNRSIYVFVSRQIFQLRRLTCSLAKVFKLSTSVRLKSYKQSTGVKLKSVKNSPSPKPTTSSNFSKKYVFYLHTSKKSSTFALLLKRVGTNKTKPASLTCVRDRRESTLQNYK